MNSKEENSFKTCGMDFNNSAVGLGEINNIDCTVFLSTVEKLLLLFFL
jgi:hypothetical protein